MIRFFDISNIDEKVLVDLLLEYTERCTNSLRGSSLSDQEYKDYKEAIESIANEIRRRRAGAANDQRLSS
jgi:hypothetical protein